MAKKTGMETFQDARPMEREFKITLPADITTEVGTEIDTDIAAGSQFAWAIVGLRWAFELVAAPNTPFPMGNPAAHCAMFLQLVRGELPTTPVCVSRHDHDLIGEDILDVVYITGTGAFIHTFPREVPFAGVTQLPTLHLTFGANVDVTPLSAATNRIVGSVLYHLVSAPKARHEDL
jgi:hypothetical protein